MKKLYTLLALILLTQSITAQQTTTKTLKSTTQTQTAPTGQFQYEVIQQYNEKGQIIKKASKGLHAIMTKTNRYQLDDEGRMMTDSAYNSEGELTQVSTYFYDEYDKIELQKRLFVQRDDYYEERYENSYDLAGNLVESKQYDKEGILDWKYTYEYDEDGNETRIFSYFQGTIRNEWTKKYKNGNCIEYRWYDYENEELKRKDNTYYFYKYNSDGLKTKTTVHSVAEHLKEKQISIRNYKYDAEGNVIEEEQIEDGRLYCIKKTVNTYW